MIEKIMNLVKRCLITIPSQELGQYPVAQVSYFGKAGNSEEIYPYGMGGVSPSGSIGIMFNVNGQEDNRSHIATAPKLRPGGLKPGETYFGNLVSGSITIFKENGDWDVTINKDGNLTFNGDLNITVNGSVNIDSGGDVEVNSSGNAEITANEATVNAGTIDLNGDCNLGGGGLPISRVGDVVLSDTFPFPPIGTIGTGSANHTAS
jgi:hypothetical protein